MGRLKFLLTALLIVLMSVGAVEAKAVEAIGGFSKKICSRTALDNDNVALINQQYSTLGLPSDLKARYPKLERALVEYNSTLERQAITFRERAIDQARDQRSHMGEYFHAYYSNSELMIRRADSAVFSVIDNGEDYLGGAHGMYGWIGANFDVETGKRLTISDVCTNADKLTEAIVARLRADYDERYFFENLDEKIIKLVAEDTINFVLEPRGVTFIFNPYLIAPYASGMIVTTILFGEQPSLFKAKYRQAPAAFAQTLGLYRPTVLEMNGRRLLLDINSEQGVVTVKFKGQEVAAAIRNAHMPTYVHTADGKNYLYVDGIADADGFSAVEGGCLTVFKLDGELEVYNRLPYTLLHMTDVESSDVDNEWWFMTDPNAIQFDSTMPVGDMNSHFGAVNSDGTFSFG